MKHQAVVGCHFLLNGNSIGLGCKSKSWMNAMKLCHDITPDKPVSVIKNWIWMNIKMDELNLIKKPEYLIWSTDVIWDYRESTSVRSQLFIRLHKNYIFEAEDAFYVLVGSGRLQDMQIPF